MKKVLLVGVLVLSGCSTAELAQRQCNGLGVYEGDAEYWNCIDREEAVVEGTRNRGAAMMLGGAYMLRPQPSIYVIRGY